MNYDFFWLLAFVIGGVAAWMDWKSRSVPNWLWLVGFALAAPFVLVEAFQSCGAFALRLSLFAAFTIPLFFLWRSDAIGGADLKGFAFFAYALSPVDYFDSEHGKFYPALDVLVTALVLAMILKLFVKDKKLPLFAVSQWPLLLAPVAGGLVWWPVLALVRLFA